MIIFKKKSDLTPPVPVETEAGRVEQMPKTAAEKQRKSDTDGTRRRKRQTVDDNRLL